MNKKDKIQMYIIFSIITLAFNITFSIFGATFNKVDNAASVGYVNSENTKQDDFNYNVHNEMKKTINSKADKTDVDDIKATLNIMDSRIYDLWIIKNK